MNQTADNGGSGLERAIERASHSESSLLFLGELGVGKCRAARAIHQRSERRTSPFIYVNCGTLADHVTDDRVFGGALAAGTSGPAPLGTLYLDQVECLSPIWQGRLSELLSSSAGQGYRLMAGGKQELAHDARAGLAGLELCRRINQSRIHLRPLRDRPLEIIPAALQFLTASTPASRVMPRMTSAVAAALITYDWPGNFIELKNAIGQAALLSETGMLDCEHLPENVVMHRPGWAFGDLTQKVRLALSQLERCTVSEALRASGGNRAKAARALGVTTRTVQYRAAKYRLEREPTKSDEDR
jgi:DNA-binding NtrC family response regulator